MSCYFWLLSHEAAPSGGCLTRKRLPPLASLIPWGGSRGWALGDESIPGRVLQCLRYYTWLLSRRKAFAEGCLAQGWHERSSALAPVFVSGPAQSGFPVFELEPGTVVAAASIRATVAVVGLVCSEGGWPCDEPMRWVQCWQRGLTCSGMWPQGWLWHLRALLGHCYVRIAAQ